MMRRCLQLAANGLLTTKPNPMVGAVIVAADGHIIGEGFTSPVGGPHAEVNAFASVKKEDEPLLPGATIYVSLEPCSHWGHTPPCCDLIISKKVRRCVCGCVDPFAKVQGRGIQRMREAGIEVTVGVLEAECRAMNERFMTFNEHHRPFIILKWAQTTDGFISGKDGAPLKSPRLSQRYLSISCGQRTMPFLWGGIRWRRIIRSSMCGSGQGRIPSESSCRSRFLPSLLRKIFRMGLLVFQRLLPFLTISMRSRSRVLSLRVVRRP